MCRSDAFFLMTSSSRTSILGCACITHPPLYCGLSCVVLGCHPVDLCQGSPAVQRFQIAVLAHVDHALCLGGFFDFTAGSPLHNQLLDGLGYLEHLIQAHPAFVATGRVGTVRTLG